MKRVCAIRSGHRWIADRATRGYARQVGNCAIVLAAGVGSRLAGVTDGQPKWFLTVGDSRISDHHLRALAAVDVDRVLVVGGHAYSVLDSYASTDLPVPVELVYNSKYATLNNWYSLLLGLRTLSPLGPADQLLVVNADLWAPVDWLTTVFADLLGATGARLAVDRLRPLTPESMKVSARDAGKVLAGIGKTGVSDPIGEYVGALALDATSAATLTDLLAECALDDSRSNEWYEHSVGRSVEVLDWSLCTVPGSNWVEIDDHADLEQAQRVASQ